MYLYNKAIIAASAILAASVGACVAAVVTLLMVLFSPTPAEMLSQETDTGFSAVTAECRRIHTIVCE